MMQLILKNRLRAILIRLGWDLTQNLKYDRLTRKILHKCLRKDSNCIDVGAHQGEVLKQMIALAPQGNHLAIEPIPRLADLLRKDFGNKVSIYEGALSDREGMEVFYHVVNAEAYSGLKTRSYDVSNAQLESIQVSLKPLDKIGEQFTPIDLIKIDVEGGEFEVLKGGEKTIRRDRPVILFECGIGGLDHYGHTPADIYTFLEKIGFQIFCLEDWLLEREPLSLSAFSQHFNLGTEYYFLAIPHA